MKTSSQQGFLPTEDGLFGQVDLSLVRGPRLQVVLLEGLLLAAQLGLLRGRGRRQHEVEGALEGQKLPQVSGFTVNSFPDLYEEPIRRGAVAQGGPVEVCNTDKVLTPSLA